MPGVGIQVGGQQPGALPADQRTAIVRLADGFVAGGKIGDHRCARQRVAAAGRHGCPQILAHLNAQHKIGQLLAGKQQIGADQRFLPGKLDALSLAHGGYKMPFFVKFAVVGQISLGYQPQQLAVADDRRAVVKLGVVAHR